MRRCNPWNLTQRQSEALDKLVQYGCRKIVAYHMEISEQALCVLLRRACQRMKVRTDMQAVLTFDRWART
jgi:FixJ family two-component response regulator